MPPQLLVRVAHTVLRGRPGLAVERRPAEGRAFRATLLGAFVTSVGLGLTLPFMFVYLNRVLGLPLSAAGFAVAAAAVLALGATAAGGVLADRHGLGRVAVLGLVGQAAGTLILAAAGEPVTGVAGLAVISMGNSLVWPSLNGLVTYQVQPQRRSRAFAVRFGAMNVGIGIGSLIAAATVSTSRPSSFHLVYALDGATTAAFALILLLGIRGTAGWATHRHRPEAAVPTTYRSVLRDRSFVAYLAVLLALAIFGSSQAEGPWAAFVALVPGGSGQVIGLAFAANTAAIVVLQLPMERWTRTLRRSRLLVLCALAGALAWALTGAASLPGLPAAASATMLVLSLGVFGLGETLLSPVINAIPNAMAPDRLRGRYNALNSATYPVSKFIGAPLAGILLGGAAPSIWVGVVTLGMLITAGGAVVLGRRLATTVEHP